MRAIDFKSNVRATAVTARAIRARERASARPTTRALGGFGPNIDAEEIRKLQAAKQAKIEANRRAAEAAKSSKAAFSGRASMQQTVASRPSRAGRTTPNGAKLPSKTTSSKTTSSENAKGAEPERKKLFGLF